MSWSSTHVLFLNHWGTFCAGAHPNFIFRFLLPLPLKGPVINYGKGGLQNGKIAGPCCAPYPLRQGQTYHPPPPSLKLWRHFNLLLLPTAWLKLQGMKEQPTRDIEVTILGISEGNEGLWCVP